MQQQLAVLPPTDNDLLKHNLTEAEQHGDAHCFCTASYSICRLLMATVELTEHNCSVNINNTDFIYINNSYHISI